MLPYYFFIKNHAAQVFFLLVFGAIWSKIGKNSQIFCNFFSLCINDLEES